MGVIQATEAIKLIVGAGELLTGRLLTYDALGMRFDEFRFDRREDCAVCGKAPSITTPRDLAEACSAEDLAAVKRLSPQTLQRSMLSARAPAIVDVREPEEFAVSHLPNAINIPVRELTSRITEIPSPGQVVFVCRSGARSLTASGIARRAGVHEPAHLEGGLLAWSKEIDPVFSVAPVG